MTNRNTIKIKHLAFSYDDYLTQNCSLIGLKIGPLTVLQKISQGSFGSVFLAMQHKTCNLFAIKLLDLKLIESQKDPKIKEIKKRLLKTQVETMVNCQSQNLIKCFEILQNDCFKLLVMEYCNGGTLQKKVKQKGQIQEKTAIEILKQILNGLSKLHKNGIIHRDLKPENILIKNNVYKIADFGFSKDLESNDTKKEIHHTNLGTLCAMSPQVFQGKQYGLQADIWSIGVIFYYMLYGKYPYEGFNRKYLLKEIENKNIFDPKYVPEGVLVSQDAKIFISLCLNIDSQNRPNWQNILQHKLFNRISQKHQSPNFLKTIGDKDQNSNNFDKQKTNQSNSFQIKSDFKNEKTQTETIKLEKSDEIVRAISMTQEQFLIKKRQYKKNIYTNNAFNRSKQAHFEYLRAEFIIKEILQPLQMCPQIFLTNHQIIKILFLVTCRCYEDISQWKSQLLQKKESVIANLPKMIESLYQRLDEKLQKYSQKLLDKQNEVFQMIKSKIFSFVQYKKNKEKRKFFIRMRSNKSQNCLISYNRTQQIQFTQKLFIQCLQKISRQQIISCQRKKIIKNYEKICSISLKDVGNTYFRTYVTNLCQKN